MKLYMNYLEGNESRLRHCALSHIMDIFYERFRSQIYLK